MTDVLLVEEDDESSNTPIKKMKEFVEKMSGAEWFKQRRRYTRNDILIVYMAHEQNYRQQIWDKSRELHAEILQGTYNSKKAASSFFGFVRNASRDLARVADAKADEIFPSANIFKVVEMLVLDFERFEKQKLSKGAAPASGAGAPAQAPASAPAQAPASAPAQAPTQASAPASAPAQAPAQAGVNAQAIRNISQKPLRKAKSSKSKK